MLEWSTQLLDCSSQWCAHSTRWDIWSTCNGSRDNWGKEFQRLLVLLHMFYSISHYNSRSRYASGNTQLIDCSSQWGAHYSNWHFWSTSNGSRDNWGKVFQTGYVSYTCFLILAYITRDPGMLQWNTQWIDCSSQWGAHYGNWHIWSTSNGSRDNWGKVFQRSYVSYTCFLTLAYITRDPGMVEWNTQLIDCSSQWGAHSCNWHIWSTSYGSRDNWGKVFQRGYVSYTCFLILAYITRDPGMLEWNTQLKDCSSQWGAHSSNWHIWSTSNGSRDNWGKVFQRGYVSYTCFLILAYITRDPGMLEWNTQLIDCSSQWGAHSSNWPIWSTSNGSRDNWGKEFLRLLVLLHVFYSISHYNSRSRYASGNTQLIYCSSQWGAHYSNWHIWSTSNGSRDNWGKVFQRGYVSYTCFLILAYITRDPGMLQWNTQWIDCSSQWGAHYGNWHIWSTSNGSRDNWGKVFQRSYVSYTCFLTLAYITRDPGMVEWNTQLIDCSSQWGAHSSNWHIWSTSNGSRDNWGKVFQRGYVSYTCFLILAYITRDPGMLQWNTQWIDCSSQWGAHYGNWHIWSTSNGSRDNWGKVFQRIYVSYTCFLTLTYITRDPGMLEWNTQLIDSSSQWGAHSSNWDIWSTSNGSWDISLKCSRGVMSLTRVLFY